MTGWRIGYAAGSEPIIKAMTNLASHSTSNPTSVAQYGAIAAYNGPNEPVEEMRKAFEDRLNKVYELLVDIPGLTCLKPEGAFYLFPNAKKRQNRAAFQALMNSPKRFWKKKKLRLFPVQGSAHRTTSVCRMRHPCHFWKKRSHGFAALS